MKKGTIKIMAALMCVCLISAIGNQVFAASPDLTLPSIKEVYKDYFLIGNVTDNSIINDKDSWDLFRHHYNTITSENDMKPSSLQPSKGIFTFDTADNQVRAAINAGMVVHGHNLCWHTASPDWMNKTSSGEPLPREEALENLKTHIDTVVRHFKEEFNTPEKRNIISWDVVNEAMDEYPDPNARWQDGLQHVPWYNAVGEKYIEEAFLAARNADPGAKLYYNEYGFDNPYKALAVYKMIKDINERYPDVHGRPLIDGIGIQCHYSLDTDLAAVEESLKKFTGLGLEISFSELGVDAGTNYSITPLQADLQALRYAQLFNLFKKYSDNIVRVTWWGLYDIPNGGWHGEFMPRIFDANLAPKPAYYAVIDPDKFISEHAGLLEDAVNIDPHIKIFESKLEGYGELSAQNLNVINTSPYTFNDVSAGLQSGEYFEIIDSISLTSIEPGQNATIKVSPKAGLPAGEYFDTLIITGDKGLYKTVDVYFEVLTEPKVPSKGIDYFEPFTRPESVIKDEWTDILRMNPSWLPVAGSYLHKWDFNTAVSNQLAYRHSWDPTAPDFTAIAYKGGFDWKNYIMEVPMRLGDNFDYDKGIIFRATENNCYLVSFNRQKGSLAYFDKVVNGVRTQLATPKDLQTEVGIPFVDSQWGYIVDGQAWVDIRLEVFGSHFKFYIDGNLIFDVVDNELTEGSVGFLADRGSVFVKNLKVTGPVDTIASASVTKLNGNQNDLEITVTDVYPDGTKSIFTEMFRIDNNASGMFNVGGYKVFVDTKGNTQVRECYIVK